MAFQCYILSGHACMLRHCVGMHGRGQGPLIEPKQFNVEGLFNTRLWVGGGGFRPERAILVLILGEAEHCHQSLI